MMPSQRRSLSRRLFLRIPLPLLAVLIGLVLGTGVWLVIDLLQTRSVRALFEEELNTRLQQQAKESRARFDGFVDHYASTARLLANHRYLSRYLDPIVWQGDRMVPEQRLVYRVEPPPWLSSSLRWRSLIRPSHILLMDTVGQVRELYLVRGEPLPKDFATRAPAVEIGKSELRVSEMNNRLYLLISQPIEDDSYNIMGVLMVVVPLDESFMAASQSRVEGSDTEVALLDIDTGAVLASSRASNLPAGLSLELASRHYVVTTRELSGYGKPMLFGTFVPRYTSEVATHRVLSLERRQRWIGALAFIAIFSLLFVLVSERLNRILRRISDFSRRALGFEQLEVHSGNQLLLLEDWMRDFTRLVLAAREEMRARHEDEMRDSETLKRAIMDSALDAIITVDEHGLIIDVNPTAEQMFGHGQQQAIGRRFDQLIVTPECRGDFASALRDCLQVPLDGEQPQRTELTVIGAGYRRFPAEVSIKPLLLRDHLFFTVYLHDITERRRQEAEIRSLAAFPSESPIPVLRVNHPGVVIFANASSDPLLNYWGIERLQTLPLYWRRLVDEVLGSGQEREIEVDADGRIFSMILAPIPELQYVNIYARDITETRNAEAQSRQHQTELVHVCRLSTMGEMATGMAHELNQPLSAIVNYANGCARRLRLGLGDNEDLLPAMEQISTQARRAGEIIKRLRAMIGRQQVVRKRVDMNDLILEVCSFVEFESRKLNIPIQTELSEQPLRIRVDLVQIEQVLLNLIRNAMDALQVVPEDERRLLVRSGRLGGRVVVVVEDNGPGVAPAVMQHLFDPFFTTKSSGMGMGLAISQTIIDDHHGRIRAETSPGGGARFVVELPAASNIEEESVAV